MTNNLKEKVRLQEENAELRARLEEVEETLRAIREGEVDAVVVSGSKGDRVFTLSESDSLSRLMVETMNEAGLAVSPDGLLIFCNDRVCALLRRTKEQLLGHDLSEFIDESDADRFRQFLRTALTATNDDRFKFLCAKGAAVPLHLWSSRLDRPEGPLVCLVGTDLSRIESDRRLIEQLQEQQQQLRESRIAALNLMKDAVAARQQTEQQSISLRESEERLALAASATQIGMFDWNLVKGTMLWTQTHEALFGYAPTTTTTTTTTTATTTREHDYRKWADRVHPEDMPIVEDALKLCKKDRKPLGVQYRIIWPDGSLHWVETKGVFLYDSNDQACRLLGVVMDITERKKAEESFFELADAKSRFAATVAHELRSPLATIKAVTELVLDGTVGPLNDEQKDLLGTAQESLARLGRLTNNVLAFKKVEAGKMGLDLTENDICEVVREAHRNAVLFAGSRKEDLVMDLGDNLPRIRFDRDKILQVMINLMANAVKYTESGAIVTQVWHENNEIHVSVRDTGPGIKAEYLERIFEPFAQVGKDKNDGAGLGLAISKEIVLAHRGRMWAESEVGTGSVFHFTLPL